MYTANKFYRTYRKVKTCKDYKCAGCPFWEQCEQKKRENKGGKEKREKEGKKE